MFNKELLKLYFICGTTTCLGKDLYTVVEDALKGGITLFQFREKGKGALEGKEKLELAIKLKNLCKKYNVPFIVNDDIELALEIDADGVHVGQDDLGVDEIALAANAKFNIPIVVTGEVDAIAVNGEVVTIHNGSAMMPKVIGTGCLLGAVLASFIGLEKGQELKSLETAMLVYNIAGEMAEKRPNGHLPGTFKVEFINALYEITDKDIEEFKKVK